MRKDNVHGTLSFVHSTFLFFCRDLQESIELIEGALLGGAGAAAVAEALESPEFEERMKTLLSPRGGSPGSQGSTQTPSP